jgi:hypothetical protein
MCDQEFEESSEPIGSHQLGGDRAAWNASREYHLNRLALREAGESKPMLSTYHIAQQQLA